MEKLLFIIGLLPILMHSCSDADFAGGSRTIKEPGGPIKPIPTVPVTPPPADATTPNGLITGDGNITACVRGKEALNVNLSVAGHRDSQSNGRYKSNPPMSDVGESTIQRFNASEIAGDLLPVDQFALDDVAFIVKDTDTIANNRDITIPEHALVIKDGNNPLGASGKIDSYAKTTYRFKNQSVSIPGYSSINLSDALNKISGMGISPINHNQIKISEMKAKGFVDANGNVAFKVVHVSHGFGFLTMTYSLRPCK